MKIKNWGNFIKEDVYWGRENVYETDKQTKERIKKWVEKWVDSQIGMEIMNVSVLDRIINVRYKKFRDFHSMNGISKEEAMERSKKDWEKMGEDMVEEMRYDTMEGVKDGLGLDLRNDYYVIANPNGYYVETSENFPNKKIGSKSRGIGG